MGMDLVQGKSTGTKHPWFGLNNHTFLLKWELPVRQWIQLKWAWSSLHAQTTPVEVAACTPRTSCLKSWKGNHGNPPPQKETGFLQKQTSLLHPTWSYGHDQSECHPHAYPRIADPTQTALFQEWLLFLWWAASKFWKDLIAQFYWINIAWVYRNITMVVDYSCTIVGGLVDKPKSPHDGWLRLVFNGQYPHNLIIWSGAYFPNRQLVAVYPLDSNDGCLCGDNISIFMVKPVKIPILSWFVSTYIYIIIYIYNII